MVHIRRNRVESAIMKSVPYPPLLSFPRCIGRSCRHRSSRRIRQQPPPPPLPPPSVRTCNGRTPIVLRRERGRGSTRTDHSSGILNLLQPSFKSNSDAVVSTTNPDGGSGGNMSAVLKPLVVTAADSTAGNENRAGIVSGSGPSAFSRGGPARGSKRKRGEKDPNMLLPGPVVKHHHSVKKFQTPSVSRRNARERNRVKHVNCGFTTLRNHIPHLKNKTSKVDTLRAAVDYIQALRRLVGENVDGEDLGNAPQFSFSDSLTENSDLLDESTASNSSSPPPQHPPHHDEESRPESRSASAQSGEINPLVYSLPPIDVPFMQQRLDQSTPSISPKSDEASSSNVVDSSTASFEDDGNSNAAASKYVQLGNAGRDWWQQQQQQRRQDEDN